MTSRKQESKRIRIFMGTTLFVITLLFGILAVVLFKDPMISSADANEINTAKKYIFLTPTYVRPAQHTNQNSENL